MIRSFMQGMAAVLVAATIASAQTTGGPGAGTGANPPMGGGGSTTGTPGSTPAPTDLDLPLDKPAYTGDPNDLNPPPVTPPDTPDPRDEPPPTIYGEEITTEGDTIFYVIDISGSMDWDNRSYTDLDGRTRNGTRMERAKVELIRSIMALSRNFSFNIIAFDCGTRQWQRSMQEATDGNKQSASAWVRALQPTGATGTGPAAALALGARENKAVVLLTDGAPNCGANSMDGHRSMIRTANRQGATINVFGIAASGSYRSFCQNVAGDSGGSYFDVP